MELFVRLHFLWQSPKKPLHSLYLLISLTDGRILKKNAQIAGFTRLKSFRYYFPFSAQVAKSSSLAFIPGGFSISVGTGENDYQKPSSVPERTVDQSP